MRRIGWTIAALLFCASPAMADVVTPDEQACEGSSAGEACTYTEPGSNTEVTGKCQAATCYQNTICDGGADAGHCSIAVACLECDSDGGSGDAGGSSSGGSSGGSSSGGSDGGSSSGGGSDSGGSGGCDVAPGSGFSSFAALLVAAIVPLVLGRRRRKVS